MKKIVLTFGLIAGAILSVMMVITFAFWDAIGFESSEILGYTSMVVAFLLIFFGVRAYRDNVAGGSVSFARAFGVGTLIAVVAAVCYVATWEVVSRTMAPNFFAEYQAHMLEEARADGATATQLAEKKAELDKYATMYKNPVIRAGMTFVEPMPVALVIALVSAGVLSRGRKGRPRENGLASA